MSKKATVQRKKTRLRLYIMFLWQRRRNIKLTAKDVLRFQPALF